MKFTCKCCGKEHNEWPAIVYSSPSHYLNLTDEQLEYAELTSDLCIIEYPEQTDRFIRVVLIQEVIENCQNLDYGVWVTLSEKNFNEYIENYNNEGFEATYSGWFSNYLPDYKSTINIPTKIIVNNSIGRPLIYPYEDYDHQFVDDFYNGITKEEAERRINTVLKM
ncbi:DUF2199 domain-containing protein [Chryseobacterium sp. Alg-005]|uniref:DUF2199 domain-containing protein n=1 Tax=Chryseobacterium sp. Alg-005 TaxID=3159516 RepID=UPI003555A88E